MLKIDAMKEAAFADDARDKLREVLWHDSNTGKFYYKDTGTEAGCLDPAKGIRIKVGKRHYWAHRLAWLFAWGRWPSRLRHMDGDKTNNRLSNLY